jgi:hypothetical protein
LLVLFGSGCQRNQPCPIRYAITIPVKTWNRGCIVWLITYPTGWVGKVLSQTCCLSGCDGYSIYLWQQPFLNPYSSLFINQFPLNILLVAGASFVLLPHRQPSLSVRQRLENGIIRISENVVQSHKIC